MNDVERERADAVAFLRMSSEWGEAVESAADKIAMGAHRVIYDNKGAFELQKARDRLWRNQFRDKFQSK